MIFIESLDTIEQLANSFFEAAWAREIVDRSMPAIAIRLVEQETHSWLYGDAMIEAGAQWPSIGGHQLQHTARIALDGLPKVVPHQPETGYLSFFDGYPWSVELRWGISDHGHVSYDDGRAVERRAGPMIPTELFWPEQRQFVAAEGPYWTVPPPEEILQLAPADDRQAFQNFQAALVANQVQTYFYGQLFGRPSPIQDDITPEPRYLHTRPGGPTDDDWLHLATFRQSGTVFSCYYAVRLGEVRARTFGGLVFAAQC